MIGFDFDDIFTEWVSVDQDLDLHWKWLQKSSHSQRKEGWLDIQLLQESQKPITSQVIVTYSFDSKQSWKLFQTRKFKLDEARFNFVTQEIKRRLCCKL